MTKDEEIQDLKDEVSRLLAQVDMLKEELADVRRDAELLRLEIRERG